MKTTIVLQTGLGCLGHPESESPYELGVSNWVAREQQRARRRKAQSPFHVQPPQKMSARGSISERISIQMITLIDLSRLWEWKANDESKKKTKNTTPQLTNPVKRGRKAKKGTTMNPLTQFKKILILPLLVALTLVALASPPVARADAVTDWNTNLALGIDFVIC
jgi:hypothetical protein